jgi:hypothetical protein
MGSLLNISYYRTIIQITHNFCSQQKWKYTTPFQHTLTYLDVKHLSALITLTLWWKRA